MEFSFDHHHHYSRYDNEEGHRYPPPNHSPFDMPHPPPPCYNCPSGKGYGCLPTLPCRPTMCPMRWVMTTSYCGLTLVLVKEREAILASIITSLTFQYPYSLFISPTFFSEFNLVFEVQLFGFLVSYLFFGSSSLIFVLIFAMLPTSLLQVVQNSIFLTY